MSNAVPRDAILDHAWKKAKHLGFWCIGSKNGFRWLSPVNQKVGFLVKTAHIQNGNKNKSSAVRYCGDTQQTAEENMKSIMVQGVGMLGLKVASIDMLGLTLGLFSLRSKQWMLHSKNM